MEDNIPITHMTEVIMEKVSYKKVEWAGGARITELSSSLLGQQPRLL